MDGMPDNAHDYDVHAYVVRSQLTSLSSESADMWYTRLDRWLSIVLGGCRNAG